jgi:polyisoprenoid-binding protein YceI
LQQFITKFIRTAGVLVFIAAAYVFSASAQPIALQCNPEQTTAKFTLGDVLHTVHGAFKVKRCDLHFDPVSSKVGGEIIFDATSGDSGNASRDRKMEKNVLEANRYPEIAFRPGTLEGNVALSGKSIVQVTGLFGIHGAEHQITVPVEINLEPERWTASAHFPVPYVKWGMKNPSMLFLRVGDTVQIDLAANGDVKRLSAQPVSSVPTQPVAAQR